MIPAWMNEIIDAARDTRRQVGTTPTAFAMGDEHSKRLLMVYQAGDMEEFCTDGYQLAKASGLRHLLFVYLQDDGLLYLSVFTPEGEWNAKLRGNEALSWEMTASHSVGMEN